MSENNCFQVVSDRKISQEELKDKKLVKMPGFKVNWNYQKYATADASFPEITDIEHSYLNEPRRLQFVR